MSVLLLTRFGNPILRESTPELSLTEIKSNVIQACIADLKICIQSKDYGVGLAAPQVGKKLSIAVIDIKPTKTRPNAEEYQSVMINPMYEGVGRRVSLWEGCLSTGLGKNTLYGKALRYKTIDATWQDETGSYNHKELSGLPAHVFQHETDHLNGILFVDRVRDTKTYMLADEYRKHIVDKTPKRYIRG